VFRHAGLDFWYSSVGEGPPVVVHAGARGDSGIYQAAGYVDALTEAGYRVVLFDHRGHGRSGKPLRREDHLTIAYVEDLVALLDELAVDRSAVIGFSQGMHVAVATAATHPDRIAALVGVGAFGAAGAPTDWRSAAAAFARASGASAAVEAMAEHEAEPLPAWMFESLATTDPEVFALLLEAGLEDERVLWDLFADVRAPTLLVVGGLEDGGNAGANAARAADLIGDAETLVVPGLAHLGVFWHAERSLPTILRFLAGRYP
jgi:pimeloyl-ACP methyl ester carboxylesterase